MLQNLASDPVVTLTSSKNRPMITKGGYLFNFNKLGAHKKIWRCTHHRQHGCPARLHTTDSDTNPEVMGELGTHNHVPDAKFCLVQLAWNKIRDTAANSTIPTAEIVAMHSSMFSQAGEDIAPLKESISRTIRNIRSRRRNILENST